MENTRQVNMLKTENFGTIAYIEVGAMLVGRIKDNGVDVFDKGQEKGYFEPGGSTIVILVNNVKIDKEDIQNSGYSSTVLHDYSVVITVNNITSPNEIVKVGNDGETLSKITSTLTVILHNKPITN